MLQPLVQVGGKEHGHCISFHAGMPGIECRKKKATFEKGAQSLHRKSQLIADGLESQTSKYSVTSLRRRDAFWFVIPWENTR